MFGYLMLSCPFIRKVFGARQDDVSIQGFSFQAAKSYILVLRTTTNSLSLVCLLLMLRHWVPG